MTSAAEPANTASLAVLGAVALFAAVAVPAALAETGWRLFAAARR